MRVLKLLIFPLYFSMVGLKSNNGEKIAHSNYFTNDVAGVLEKIYTICQGWCSASARDGTFCENQQPLPVSYGVVLSIDLSL